MSQATDCGNDSRGAGTEADGLEQQQQQLRSVLLRKSCDLCVRLKRACDGKSPCQLCQRRRETCTRSVKRKSGPAKGTKYSTRRQRLEAGIADRTPPKPRGGRGRGVGNTKPVDNGTAAVAAATAAAAAATAAAAASNVVSHQAPASSAGRGVGSSRGARGSHRGAFRGMSLGPYRRVSVPIASLSTSPAHNDVLQTPRVHDFPAAPAGAPLDAGRGRVGDVGSSGSSVEGSGDVGGGVIDERTLAASRPNAGGEQGMGGVIEARMGTPRGGFTAGSPRGRNEEESGNGNGNGGDGGSNGGVSGDGGGHSLGSTPGVLPRRTVSPLCLPMLSWSAGGDGGGGDPDQARGRSTSPFGLLPGTPSLVGRVRRGGTREPPVEAGAGANHFWGSGLPPPKRFRMSGREPALGAQQPDHGGGGLNGMSLGPGGDRAHGGNEMSASGVSGVVVGQDAFRPSLRDLREQTTGFPPLGGQSGQLLGHTPFSAPLTLGTFDSPSGAQAPYAAVVDRHNGNGGSFGTEDSVDHQQLQAPGAAAAGMNGDEHSRISGQRQDWVHPAMRVLPPPGTGIPPRAAPIAEDALLSRMEGTGGDGGNIAATRWRGSDVPVGESVSCSDGARVNDDHWRDKSSQRSPRDAGLGEGHGDGGVSGRREGGDTDGESTRRCQRELLAGRGVSQAPWSSDGGVVASVSLPDNACDVSRSWGTNAGAVGLPNVTGSSGMSDGNPDVTGGSGGGTSSSTQDGSWEFNTSASFRRQGNSAGGMSPDVPGVGGLGADADGRGGDTGAPTGLPLTSDPERTWVGDQLGVVTTSPSSSATKPSVSREETKTRLPGSHPPQSSPQLQGRTHALPSVEAFGSARADNKNSLPSPSFSLPSGNDDVGSAAGSNGMVSVPAAATALEAFRGSGSLPTWAGGGGGVQQALTAPPSQRNPSPGEAYFPTAETVSALHTARAEGWVPGNGGSGGGRQDGANVPLVNADVAVALTARTREARLGKATPAEPNAGWHTSWGAPLHGHVQRAGFEREGATWPSEYSI